MRFYYYFGTAGPADWERMTIVCYSGCQVEGTHPSMGVGPWGGTQVRGVGEVWAGAFICRKKRAGSVSRFRINWLICIIAAGSGARGLSLLSDAQPGVRVIGTGGETDLRAQRNREPSEEGGGVWAQHGLVCI